jgi:hypothetical protein
MRRGLPVAAGIPSLQTGVEIAADGGLLLDVRADVSDALRERIEALGGRIVASVPSHRSLRVRLPIDAVEALASDPAVQAIRPADLAFTRKINTSEGDGAHYASAARAAFGVDGTGVKVGVLSDGVSSLASLIASGDLPPNVTVLPGQAGSGSEGTAMLEIIHDLSPGASLLFATAFTSQASFASNIVALRNAGADVIVDDVGYFAEAVFQDDDVAAAVDQVVADGALYFSAAGNSGNLDDGTAGVWQGDFVPGSIFHGHPAHDYGGGDITNEVTQDSPSAFTLHWSDPLGASANDYDLFLTNKTGTLIVAASTNVQSGSGDPFEIIGSGPNDKGRQLIIVRTAGQARFLHLNANRGALEHASVGQIGGHPGARGAVAVAAVDARGKTAGFTGSEPVETFSSDGPRRVFFAADGSPYTPGNFSATGGELRGKPELTGADCVHTATPGFDPFCGTSAAAPHAAAIAALLIERAGGPGSADPAAIVAAMRSTSLDIEAPGVDRDAGSGIAHALAAAGAVSPPGCSGDPDCDDGVFCNGAETCNAGTCVPGTPPACSGPTPYCDEGLDACVQCLTSAQCNDGLFCNGAEACSAGACAPGTPPACSGPTPHCDESLDACVQCLTSAQCNDGLFCNGAEACNAGACTAGTPPACTAPTPYCDEGLAACVQCLTPAQCDDGLFCDGAETCSAGTCAAGAPPVCTSPAPYCANSLASCVECLANSDCGSGLCQAGACAPPQIPALNTGLRALLALALLGIGAFAALRARRR